MRWLQGLRNFRKRSLNFSTQWEKLKPPWNVLFFGTDDFSVASLKALNDESNALINRLEIVTSPKNNPVRKYAQQNSLSTHSWPLEGPIGQFDVGLVVSFGHLLPREVIDSFPMGMLNVHASLLPRWRGAAPIIYALMHGDAKTGVTVMRVRPEKFDVGEVVRQEEVGIGADVRMPELHTMLAELGAVNLVETLRDLPKMLKEARPQDKEGVTLAPRVGPSLAVVNFFKPSRDVYNLSRALTGLYPLAASWNGVPVKFHNLVSYETHADSVPGAVVYLRERKLLKVGCADGSVLVDRIGVQHKKVMNATEFNNGFVKKQPVERRVFSPSLAVVNFFKPSRDVYNLSRALTGLYPLAASWNGVPVKFHNLVSYETHADSVPGAVVYLRERKLLKVGCADGSVLVDRIGVQHKKVMNATEFNNGFVKKQPVERRVFR